MDTKQFLKNLSTESLIAILKWQSRNRIDDHLILLQELEKRYQEMEQTLSVTADHLSTAVGEVHRLLDEEKEEENKKRKVSFW